MKWFVISSCLALAAAVAFIFFQKSKLTAVKARVEYLEKHVKAYKDKMKVLKNIEARNEKVNRVTRQKIIKIRKIKNINNIVNMLNYFFKLHKNPVYNPKRKVTNSGNSGLSGS